MKITSYLAAVASAVLLLPVAVSAQQPKSLDIVTLEGFLQNGMSEAGVLTRIGQMCPDFAPTDAGVTQRLRALSASDRVLQALAERRTHCAPAVAVADTATTATLVLQMSTPNDTRNGVRFPFHERVVLIGARGDTVSRLTTDTLGWTAPVRVPTGQYTINAQHTDTLGHMRYEWRVPLTVMPGRTDTLLLGTHNTAAAIAIEPERHVDSVFTPKQIFDRARGSLLAVQGREQHGSAIVLDTAGVTPSVLFLATSYRLVRDAADIRVTVNDTLRLKARLVSGDSTSDVAVLSVPRDRCTGCRPARLSDSTVSAEEQPVVIGAPSYRGGRNVAQPFVKEVSANGFVLDQMLDSTANGGAVYDEHGRVVGMWTSRAAGTRRDFSMAVGSRQLRIARDSAVHGKVLPPYAQTLPIAPRRPFPAAALTAASSMLEQNLKPFTFTTGEFKVMIMTPQIAAWRAKRAEEELQRQKPSFKPTDPEMVDPIEVWSGWKDYLASRQALVLVQVTPKDAGFPTYDVNKVVTRAKADVWDVILTRGDSTVVEPVDRALVPTMVRWSAAKARGIAAARQELMLYRISDFRLNDDGSSPFMQLSVADAKNPKGYYTFIIPPTTIDALNTAFRVWLNSAEQAAMR